MTAAVQKRTPGMTREQITNRYVRGWISEAEFRAEMVKLYDREDEAERIQRIVDRAFELRNRHADGDPIQNLVRLAVRLALNDAATAKATGSAS